MDNNQYIAEIPVVVAHQDNKNVYAFWPMFHLTHPEVWCADERTIDNNLGAVAGEYITPESLGGNANEACLLIGDYLLTKKLLANKQFAFHVCKLNTR